MTKTMTTHIPDAQLAEWLALAEKATPGPWLRQKMTIYALHHNGSYNRGVPLMVNRFSAHVEDCLSQGGTEAEAEANAALITAARLGWPATIRDLLETREVLLEATDERVDGLHLHGDYCKGNAEPTTEGQDTACTCWWGKSRLLLDEKVTP